jgi:CheY-like chemotaxis protein
MCRILVVDDDHVLLGSLRRCLHLCSAKVTTAESAEQALELCRAQAFDLVLTDYNMNGASGVWLLEQLQQQYPSLRRALMSGFAVPNLDDCQRRGIVDVWLPKDTLSIERLGELVAETRAAVGPQ